MSNDKPDLKVRYTIEKTKKFTINENLPNMLILKFKEGTHIRLDNKSFIFEKNNISWSEEKVLERLKLDIKAIKSEIAELNTILKEKPDLEIQRLFSRSDKLIDKEKQELEEKTKEEIADLNLYYAISFKVATFKETEELGNHLQAFTIIELIYQPTLSYPAGVDIPPTTPSFGQDYLGPAPRGIDAHFAWNFEGGKGRRIRLIDIEAGWDLDHEDLPDLRRSFYFAPGIGSLFEQNHGTAVVGIIGAKQNAYGITGIANECDIGVGTSLTIFGVANAIDNAADRLGPGDVILIEVEVPGPTTPDVIAFATGQIDLGAVPVEHYQAEFDAIRRATARGVIIVEAAGNGNMDLDLELFGGRFDRNVRDSGAIMVGADSGGTRVPARFTNFGSRVDVHGWGEGVVTTGYGDLTVPNMVQGDRMQLYTNRFNGTSSASAILAGAIASLQGIRRAQGRPSLNSREMRDLLVMHGTPQATDPKHIGPLPNLRAIIELEWHLQPPGPPQWPSLGGLIDSAPAVIQRADGRLDVFVVGADGNVHHRLQRSPSNNYFLEWSRVRFDNPVMFTGRPVAIRNSDGRIEVFVRGRDNAIWHIYETAPNREFSSWGRLGGECTSDPAVGLNQDGRLEVFVRWSDGSIHHTWQMARNGVWFTFGWPSMEGIAQGNPAVALNGDGRLEVFCRGGDNCVYSRSQVTMGSVEWSNWTRLGREWDRIISDPLVTRHVSNRFIVFGQGLDNQLHHIWQTASNSGWAGANWQLIGGSLSRNTNIAISPGGGIRLFARWDDNTVRHLGLINATPTWSSWDSLGGSVTSDPAVGINENGLLEVFARGSDRTLIRRKQPF